MALIVVKVQISAELRELIQRQAEAQERQVGVQERIAASLEKLVEVFTPPEEQIPTSAAFTAGTPEQE